jgi:muramoyltetrapeptide carboxypeptidase
VSLTTRAGLLKVRPVRPGSRIGLVAPASPFNREAFNAGVYELRRLQFEPVFDERVFERRVYVAGDAERRAAQLLDFWRRADVDALIAVRGGYGSVQVLPYLSTSDAQIVRQSRAAMVGYSDVTSLHVWLAGVAGMVSIHGPMIDRRLSAGTKAYDAPSFLGSLSTEPVGELTPAGVEVLKPGEASGPLFGGTLTQLTGSLGTPWAFDPPQGHILFIDEVSERPYRIDRMLVHLQQAGILARAAGIVVGQCPRCDEPESSVTGRATVADTLRDFPGPVLFGFPSGHTTTPLVTMPFGVHARMLTAGATPGLVIEEAAAHEDAG